MKYKMLCRGVVFLSIMIFGSCMIFRFLRKFEERLGQVAVAGGILVEVVLMILLSGIKTLQRLLLHG